MATRWPVPFPTLAWAALALALPASILVNRSFRPLSIGLSLAGQGDERPFELAARQSLFLEYELTLHPSAAERPAVGFQLNDRTAAVVRDATPFATARGKLLLPLDAVRAGHNRLRVEIEDGSPARFEARVRLHNYYGIAPDFPRAVVVADEATRLAGAQRSPSGRGARFAAVYLVCLLALWCLGRIRRPGSRREARLLLLLPCLLPWLALAYSLATPLHLWLSPAALVTIGLGPWVMAVAALWAAEHRGTVARVVTVGLLTLLLLEAAFRTYHHFHPSFIFYSDSWQRYRGQPGARHFDQRLNRRGFNDAEREIARAPGLAYRIVALGDSFTFGVVPRSANFLALLERELGREAPVEVLNLGVSGTEPADYLAILAEEGLRFRPDLVMVGFYVGNDFEARARKPHERSLILGFAHFLWRLGQVTATPTASGEGPAVYQDDAPTIARERFLEIAVDRAWIYDPRSPRLTGATARALQSLGAIRDLSRRAGAEVLVVIMPDQAQVDGELQAELSRALGRAPAELDFARPNRALADSLAAAGIPCLDLLPAFAAAAPSARLYKPRDTHWNLAGNRLAAATIAAALRQPVRARAAVAAPTSGR